VGQLLGRVDRSGVIPVDSCEVNLLIDCSVAGDFPTTNTFLLIPGMSSRIGTVLNGRKTYIGGAPRSLDLGQVLLFEPAVNADDETLHITPDHYLTGDQFGASFGYDIVLVDFNSDG